MENIQPKPPDPPPAPDGRVVGGSNPSVDTVILNSNLAVAIDAEVSSRKRPPPASASPTAVAPKRVVNNTTDCPENVNDNSSLYIHPNWSSNKTYSEKDNGPFIVHITKEDNNLGVSLRPVKIGHFLYQKNIKQVMKDGVKSVGRNRVAVHFNSYTAANEFVNISALKDSNLHASIPTYQVTRMGLVRGIPSEWSMKEFVQYLELPENCGEVLKARRLNRKTVVDGSPVWVPTQTVVLTISGQRLPKHIYCCHTSIAVEVYLFPTIQCINCCRFGHVKAQCRSKPRCYRCAQPHTGETCQIPEDKSTCLHCSGTHFASNKNCPELIRQKAIKTDMAENSISYIEASRNHPPVRRPYSEIAKTNSSPTTTSPSTSKSPSNHGSRTKTVFIAPRKNKFSPSGFDIRSHYDLTHDYSPPSPVNGCGYGNPSADSTNSSAMTNNITHNDNLLDHLLSTLISIICRYDDTQLPTNVAQKLNQLVSFLHNGPASHTNDNNIPSVE